MVEKKEALYRKLLILIYGILLLISVVIGSAIVVRYKNNMKQQLQARMLDVLKVAGALLDGDVLESLQSRDKDTDGYKKTYETLRVFQENFNLKYIYLVRDMKDGTFSFTIDPDPVSPGAFGEPVESTDALINASNGIPSFDSEPYEDRWGRFYSAYSPIFDSKGKVGGIIAVDIDAKQYENQVWEYILSTVIISIISIFAGGIIFFLIVTYTKE